MGFITFMHNLHHSALHGNSSNTDHNLNEPPHDKINKMACAPSEDSDQPGHPPSLIRAFAVRMKKAWVLSYPLSAQQRLWSDWEDAQADPSLRWAHMPFCWFCHEAAQIGLHFVEIRLLGINLHYVEPFYYITYSSCIAWNPLVKKL